MDGPTTLFFSLTYSPNTLLLSAQCLSLRCRLPLVRFSNCLELPRAGYPTNVTQPPFYQAQKCRLIPEVEVVCSFSSSTLSPSHLEAGYLSTFLSPLLKLSSTHAWIIFPAEVIKGRCVGTSLTCFWFVSNPLRLPLGKQILNEIVLVRFQSIREKVKNPIYNELIILWWTHLHNILFNTAQMFIFNSFSF